MKKKHKVLLLDDEILITDGLQKTIDWASLNCTICGVGNDGLTGIDLINDASPDIVVTDILMPGKTGLDVAEYVYNNCPGTFVIIITAYEDFDMARRAIAYGVKDYIVKPIDSQKLTKSIESIIGKLAKEQSVKPILSQAILFDMAIYGIDSNQGISDIFDKEFNCGLVTMFKTAEYSGILNELKWFSAKNEYIKALEESGKKFIYKQFQNKIITIFAFGDSKTAALKRKQVIDLLNSILNQIMVDKEIVSFMSVGDTYNNSDEINRGYLQAEGLLEQSFFCGSPILFEPASGKRSANHDALININPLIDLVSLGDKEGALSMLSEIIGALTHSGGRETAIHTLRQLILSINSIIAEYEEITDRLDVTILSQNGSIVNIKTQLEEGIGDVCSWIKAKSRITDSVKLIIHKRYSESQLNLGLIAEELHLNQSYVSRLFKKENGETFIKYLTDYRIEKAKQLLTTTSYKTGEIARKVGFIDERYFSQVFKRSCKTTPTEYKAKFNKNTD